MQRLRTTRGYEIGAHPVSRDVQASRYLRTFFMSTIPSFSSDRAKMLGARLARNVLLWVVVIAIAVQVIWLVIVSLLHGLGLS